MAAGIALRRIDIEQRHYSGLKGCEIVRIPPLGPTILERRGVPAIFGCAQNRNQALFFQRRNSRCHRGLKRSVGRPTA